MDFRRFPKVELHLHLDCSLSYEAVRKLRPSVTLLQYSQEYVAPQRCTNLADFLSRAPKGFQLMQSEESLRVVTEDLFGQLLADGVMYAELRFAPLLHVEGGLTAEAVVEVVDATVSAMIRETGIEARVILCTLRHFSELQSMETVRLLDRFRGSRVIALDLAADEAGHPLDSHIAAYDYARQQSYFRTAHAGEARGPDSVWETLQLLQPHRIGHGTRSIEDPLLVEHLRQHAIHLELCPTANVQIIETIDCWENHPIDRLFRAGVRLNANTDSRMLTPATLTGEYAGLDRVFHWGPEEFLQTNLMAIEAAFVEDDVKLRLRSRLTSSFQEWLRSQ